MQLHETVPPRSEGDRGSMQHGDDDGSKTLLQATLLQQHAHLTTFSHWQRDNYERRTTGSQYPDEQGSGGSIGITTMSNSRRKQGSVENQEGQVWSTLRTRLAALNDAQAKATETTNIVNDLQAKWDDMEAALAQQAEQDQIDDDQDDERRELRDKLLEALDRLHEESERESSLASEALESLGIIMALRAPEQLQVPVDTNKRKKRRLDASPAPSDISSARASPAPQAGPPTPSLEKVSRSLSRSLSINTTGQATSSPGPEPTPATATTIAPTPGTARSIGKQQQQPALLTRKERKEAIVAQLPLKEGRPVAFKPPAKALGKGAKIEPGSLDYILTRVVRCIAGDKNRYEVQDVQDEHEVDGKPGASYNTTLKHLIVLPDPTDKSTYPINPYPVGTDVLAMYPDTTSFYRAKVVATPGNKRQTGNYKVIFEDDDDQVRTVSMDYVAEPSDGK